MAVETLKCPMCGAPASTDSTRCEHCGARLATAACASCFGMMFLGEKFCSHCGAQAARAEMPAATKEPCPRCRVELKAVIIGNTNLRECAQCEGIWADADALQKICTDREQQAAVLGVAGTLPAAAEVNVEEHIHYLPCPVCQQLMNRVNFAHCSHVIVNVCKRHGTWFDKDELRQMVEFIRAGGLEESRSREIAELEEERRRGREVQSIGTGSLPASPVGTDYDAWHTGISTAADLLLKLFLK
jgi:Zn-finger nucleic acid-binding protein